MADLKIKFSVEGVRAVLSSFRRIGQAARRVAARIKRAMAGAAAAMGRMRTSVLLVGTAMLGLVGLSGRAAGRFEMLKLRLKVVTGSAEAATVAFKEIFAFSTRTPFDPAELVEAAILLKAFGLEGMDALKNVGEAAAAMERPLADIAMAVGSMETDPMRSLGIEIARVGDKATVSFRDKLGKELVKSAKGVQAIRELILETFSIKFGGGLDEASTTLLGLLSTLKGNIFAAFATVGEQLQPIFKPMIGALNAFVTKGIESGALAKFGDQVAGFAISVAALATYAAQNLKSLETVATAVGDVIVAAFADGAEAARKALSAKGEKFIKEEGASLVGMPGLHAVKAVIDSVVNKILTRPEQKQSDKEQSRTAEALQNLGQLGDDEAVKIQGLIADFAAQMKEAAGGGGGGPSAADVAAGMSDTGGTSALKVKNISVGDLKRWQGMARTAAMAGPGGAGLMTRDQHMQDYLRRVAEGVEKIAGKVDEE